uniref:Uncharacterized protein n=1 Tax=Panagrolaimus superbus TaxID=310955 RepID=A0A914YYZ4_9BILA
MIIYGVTVFKSTYIRGNDPNNFLYFVGGTRIDAILNGNEDFTVEDVYKKGVDEDEEGVNNENEEREEEFEINNDFHVFGYNIVPDVVYRRALTPRIPYDCKNRDEEFYSRDDILILWEPQEIIRLAFEDNRGSSYPMEYVIRQVVSIWALGF